MFYESLVLLIDLIAFIAFEHTTTTITAHNNKVFNDAFRYVYYFGLNNFFDHHSNGRKKHSDCLRNEKGDYHISVSRTSVNERLTNFVATSETKSNR